VVRIFATVPRDAQVPWGKVVGVPAVYPDIENISGGSVGAGF